MNRLIKQFEALWKSTLWGAVRTAVQLLVICGVLFHASPLRAENKHETPGDGGRSLGINSGGGSFNSGSCKAQPAALAEFAKGVAFNFPQMVNYLTSPECLQNGRIIAQAAISKGEIKWDDKGPLRLDRYADQLNGEELESWERVDALVANTFPNQLRQNPIPSRQLLPLAAQVSLLSQRAGKEAWLTLIQQQLYTGDAMIENANGEDSKKTAATTLANELDRMGLEKPAIAQAMAGRIQELALEVQTDSLAKIFRALGAAAGVDPDLGSVFNLSAVAVDRGIQRGDRFYSNLDRQGLLKMLYESISHSLGVNEDLEEGGAEFNKAMTALLHGETLDLAQMGLVWTKLVGMLGQTKSQTVLAGALAASLTPDMVYLPQKQIHALVAAGKNYPDVALSIQKQFLGTISGLDEKSMNPNAWKQLKQDFLSPAVTEILSLGPDRIDSVWLRESLERGLLNDEQIEKSLPRLVLAYLGEREKKMRMATRSSDGEAGVGMMAENLALTWALSTVHYPALVEWAKRYEQKKN